MQRATDTDTWQPLNPLQTPHSEGQRLSMSAFPLPLNQSWDSSVPSPVVNSDQLCPHVVSLSLSDALAVYNATR